MSSHSYLIRLMSAFRQRTLNSDLIPTGSQRVPPDVKCAGEACTYDGGNQPSVPFCLRPYHQPRPSCPTTVTWSPTTRCNICVWWLDGGSKLAIAVRIGMLLGSSLFGTGLPDVA